MSSGSHGVFPCLVSPVVLDGTVLEAELRRLVDHLADVDRMRVDTPIIASVAAAQARVAAPEA